jgi:penicillin-insensitive murein DD-endopeptidase
VPDVLRRAVRTFSGVFVEPARRQSRPPGVLLLAVMTSGCLGVFASGDRASISVGSHAKGALLHAVAMPVEGAGYEIHSDWRSRDHRYATAQVARWLTEVFRDFARAVPGSTVFLGDISARSGGGATMHRSHASGRDIDIFYLARNDVGEPVLNLPAMLHFADDGKALRWSAAVARNVVRTPVPEAAIDLRRNWELVRTMLSNRTVEVQWIFIHEPIADALLEEAERVGAPASLIARARMLFHQPTDSQPHDDHMHVRVFCDPDDRAFGCSDKGPRRWLKKHWKYMAAEVLSVSAAAVPAAR